MQFNLCLEDTVESNIVMFSGPLKEVEGKRLDILCKICSELRESYASPCQASDATDLSKEVPNTTGQSAKILDTADQSRKVQDSIDRYDLFQFHPSW